MISKMYQALKIKKRGLFCVFLANLWGNLRVITVKGKYGNFWVKISVPQLFKLI